MTVHAYRPALLAGRLRFDTGPERLVCAGEDGSERWSLDWRAVTVAAFIEHRMRGLDMRRLDLVALGQRRSVGCSVATGDPAADADAAAHLRLIAAILDRLAETDPGFAVGIGEYGRWRWAMFATGVVAASGAVLIVALAVATGVSSDRLAEAAVPMLVLFALGAVLTWSQAPWRPRRLIPEATLAAALRNAAQPAGTQM